MGHRPLNIGDILVWCQFHGIDDIRYRQWLWYFIRKLDATWLELAEIDAENRRRRDEAFSKWES